MKALIIQENGRHEENRDFRECYSLQRAFSNLGMDSVIWGLGHDNFRENPSWGDYDFVVNLENYDVGWVPDISAFKGVKFLWAIDAHFRGMDPYLREFKRGKYTKILQSTKEFVDENSVWLPNCFDDEKIMPMPVKKEFDVGFCGNINNRGGYLDFVASHFDLRKDIFVIGEDMVRAINSYKIHFNKNISIDINYRTFETIGCGTVLVTDYNPHLEELGFKDGENCLLYKDMDSIPELIRKVLGDELFRKQLEKNAISLSRKHTYYERAKRIKELAEL